MGNRPIRRKTSEPEIYDPFKLFEVKGDNIRLNGNTSALEKICKEKEDVDILKIDDKFNLNILIRYFSTDNSKKAYGLTGHYSFKNNLKKSYFNFYPTIGKVLSRYLKEVGIDSTFNPIEREDFMLTNDQRTIKLDNENLSFLYLDEQQLLSSDNSIFNILKIMYFSPIYNEIFPELLSYELNKTLGILPAIKELSKVIRDESIFKKAYKNIKNRNKIKSYNNEKFIRYINKTLTKGKIDNILNYDEVHRIC